MPQINVHAASTAIEGELISGVLLRPPLFSSVLIAPNRLTRTKTKPPLLVEYRWLGNGKVPVAVTMSDFMQAVKEVGAV